MAKPWKLKRTAQCAKCPWRKDVDPHDIPNGYDMEKHKALAETIADPSDPLSTIGKPLRIMTCHETHNSHCIGWLHNQRGDGNNVALRYALRDCTNADRIRLRGEQHESFEATLPPEAQQDPSL